MWRFDPEATEERRGKRKEVKNNVNTLSLSLKCIERESRLTDHEPDLTEIFTSSLTVSVHHFFQPRSLFDFDNQFWEATTLDLPIHSFVSTRVMEKARGEGKRVVTLRETWEADCPSGLTSGCSAIGSMCLVNSSG